MPVLAPPDVEPAVSFLDAHCCLSLNCAHSAHSSDSFGSIRGTEGLEWLLTSALLMLTFRDSRGHRRSTRSRLDKAEVTGSSPVSSILQITGFGLF